MQSAARWYRDPESLAIILRAYLPWLGGLNLAWETAHVPLYTLWDEASAGYIAFSIAHCTLGDLVIGASALVVALLVTRAGAAAVWPWTWLAATTALIGTAYTTFSEWMNTSILQSWAYADSMPVVGAFGVQIGLTPVLQWLIVPPLALVLARRRVK